MLGIKLNPITRKRLRRFREMKRAYWSLWILAALYAVSLCAELLCNSVPLYVRYEGRSYWPVFKFYPDDLFTGSGKFTRPDYKAIDASPEFRRAAGAAMVWPLVPYGPYEVIEPSQISVPDHVTVRLAPEPRVGSVSVTADFMIVRSASAASFFGAAGERQLRGERLTEWWRLPGTLEAAVRSRFRNEPGARIAAPCRNRQGTEAELSLSDFRPRSAPPKLVRLTLRETGSAVADVFRLAFDRAQSPVDDPVGLWGALPEATKETLRSGVAQRFQGAVENVRVTIDGAVYVAGFAREDVRFPFRPVQGHWMGVDSSGRDVLARVLYGLRTSMTFGLVLVVCSLCIGTVVGAVQGYFGGVVDIGGQRLIEIWSALPFLYIMILMGSVYGRSFGLLLFCYGLFNWIGISYYMRAEVLRLRQQPFVEAARCLGLPTRKIVFRHILPNGLVPLITFFPFSLVGAIGSLAALDYLGFGLPPPTPSWGELLQQAQEFRWAWWLILYPSLALFVVMLHGVFIGEGVRNAFDPRRHSRLR